MTAIKAAKDSEAGGVAEETLMAAMATYHKERHGPPEQFLLQT